MQTLKIIKISEGVFKHIIVEESGIEHFFYNTTETKLSIDLGTFSISSAGQNRNFTVENIEVFNLNALTPISLSTIDDLVSVLAELNYPLLVNSQSNSMVIESGSDKELIVTTYVVKNPFSGADIGDTITATQVIDAAEIPFTVLTIWRNQTLGVDLASTPSATNLSLLGTQALTNAQLRAEPLKFTIVSGSTSSHLTFNEIISTLIVESSNSRKSLSIFNDADSGQILYLLAGSDMVSPNKYTYALVPGGCFIAEPQEVGCAWSGIFSSNPTKNAQITISI